LFESNSIDAVLIGEIDAGCVLLLLGCLEDTMIISKRPNQIGQYFRDDASLKVLIGA
jgi:hypothetical protein